MFSVMNTLIFAYSLIIIGVLNASLIFSQESIEKRRLPEKFSEITTSTTFDPLSDDVYYMPLEDFRALDYWYGRRLKKRSLLSIDDVDKEKKSGYSSWGGKRRYMDIFQLPKGFSPNGGKRARHLKQYESPDKEKEGKKRTAKTFANWAGKRSKTNQPFIIWGGKRSANSFKNWGGKRIPFADNYQDLRNSLTDTQFSPY